MKNKRRTIFLALIITIFLAAGGFVASLFLIPSDDYIAELKTLDQTAVASPEMSEVGIEQYRQRYMEQLSTGNLSYQAAEAYAQSLLAANQTEEAAQVWQDYVDTNPEDLAGWKEFARIHQAAANEDAYLYGLQNIARLEPTEENLVALSSYQNYKEDYAGQVETLKKLVASTNEGNPKYLLDLADIALLVEDKEAALAALNSYYTKHAAKLAEEAAKALVPETLVDQEMQSANGDVPPPPPLPEGMEIISEPAAEEEPKEELPALTESPAVTVDYSRLPTYVRLLAQAERDSEALAQALEHTKDGRGVEVRSQVAEALLYDAGPEVAVEYVETISAQGKVPEPLRAVYARALVQQGKYDVALPILKELATQGGDYREWYFLAVSAAAKEDQQARRDLVSHVKDSFAAGDLTEAQKMDRVYALLNVGEKRRALDYTERSMHATDDPEAKAKWRDIYKGLTARPKQARATRVARVTPRVSLDQKLSLARKAGAKEDFIRKTAFELLAAKRKDDAVELFSILAAQNGPTSSDTNQLIYLWGARITGAEMSWVIDQAVNAGPADQAGWVALIANHAAAEDIIAIAQNYPSWLQHPKFERRYVDALMATDNVETLNQYIASQADASQNVEVYHALASKAESLMDLRTAEQALQKAAEADPANRDTWLRMTTMYMARARHSAAEQTIANALNSSSRLAGVQAARQELATNYYAAASAKYNGENQLAEQYYSNVVAIGDATPLGDRDSQVKLLVAHMALGNEQAASQGFENLLERYPGDAVLLADYLSALMDRGLYLEAMDVAGRHGNDVSVDNAVAIDDSSPLVLYSPTGHAPLLQSMSGGRELKIIFDGPIPANHALFANQQAPDWVSYTTASYDTVLVVAQSGYSMQAAESPQGLVISAVPGADMTAAEATRQRYLRLQLLYARMELETGTIDKALERLESLASIYQEYPEYRAYQANAEYYAGNLKRGLNLIKRAQKNDPGNEDIRYLRRNIERFHGEHLKLDHEFRRLGSHDMHITTLEARKQFDNSIEVTARYQNNFLNTGVIRRANNVLQVADTHRWQAELSLAKFMDDSSIIEGSIYGNKSTPGLGLSYQFVNPLGTTNLYGQWRKPYWDVVESIVEDGTRDRIAAWHLWRPNPKWTIRVDGGYNRYNIDGEDGIADAIGVQGLILRPLWDRQPYVALAYGFDGEYMFGKVDRGPAGNKLLPLRSREIHSLSGIFYYDFSLDTNAELSAGYAVDRLGEHGPAVEGRFNHYLTEETEVQLRARYGLEAGNTDNDALSVGGYVRWTW